MLWTKEAVQLLVDFAAADKSYSDAAEALGCTRNQVAGKARRAGIAFHCDPVRAKERQASGAKATWDRLTPEARSARLAASTLAAQAKWLTILAERKAAAGTR